MSVRVELSPQETDVLVYELAHLELRHRMEAQNAGKTAEYRYGHQATAETLGDIRVRFTRPMYDPEFRGDGRPVQFTPPLEDRCRA